MAKNIMFIEDFFPDYYDIWTFFRFSEVKLIPDKPTNGPDEAIRIFRKNSKVDLIIVDSRLGIEPGVNTDQLIREITRSGFKNPIIGKSRYKNHLPILANAGATHTIFWENKDNLVDVILSILKMPRSQFV